jgi:hypothetical protein
LSLAGVSPNWTWWGNEPSGASELAADVVKVNFPQAEKRVGVSLDESLRSLSGSIRS